MRVELNPRGLDPAEYIGRLNECFPRQWSEREYEWYLSRPNGPLEPDLMVIEDGSMLGGIGLNYRTLRLPDRRRLPVAIITGAWTRPTCRGRGVFKRLVEEAREQSSRRGIALTMGFVTADNPSRKGMAACGAVEVPSWYMTTTVNNARAEATTVRRRDLDHTDFASLRQPRSEPRVRFDYERYEAWYSQFLTRPGGVVCLEGDGWVALLEDGGHSWRLLRLWTEESDTESAVRSLAAWCAVSGKRFFLFTSDPVVRAAGVRAGMSTKAGAITFMVSSPAILHSAGSQERPVDFRPEDLIDRSSPSFLGEWDVDGGDRM